MIVGLTGHLRGERRGFIGGWLSQELTHHGHQVVELAQDVRQGYITVDPEVARCDVVVHLAARVGRLRCEQNPRDVVDTNAWGTYNVATACRRASTRLLYVSSSEAAYAGNLYGLTKRWGEEAAELAFHDAPFDLNVARLFMPYGEGLPPGHGRAALVNWIHQAMHGERLTVHRGTSRSWCYVADTVRALRLILEDWQAEPQHGALWNVGRVDNVQSSLDTARLAVDLFAGGNRSLIDEVDPPAGIAAHKYPDVTPLSYGIGWAPTVDLVDGMRYVHDWLRLVVDPLKETA